MKIEKNLPFERCDNCESFILECFDQTKQDEKGNSERVVNVCCKNAWICKMTEERYEKKYGNSGSNEKSV